MDPHHSTRQDWHCFYAPPFQAKPPVENNTITAYLRTSHLLYHQPSIPCGSMHTITLHMDGAPTSRCRIHSKPHSSQKPIRKRKRRHCHRSHPRPGTALLRPKTNNSNSRSPNTHLPRSSRNLRNCVQCTQNHTTGTIRTAQEYTTRRFQHNTMVHPGDTSDPPSSKYCIFQIASPAISSSLPPLRRLPKTSPRRELSSYIIEYVYGLLPPPIIRSVPHAI